MVPNGVLGAFDDLRDWFVGFTDHEMNVPGLHSQSQYSLVQSLLQRFSDGGSDVEQAFGMKSKRRMFHACAVRRFEIGIRRKGPSILDPAPLIAAQPCAVCGHCDHRSIHMPNDHDDTFPPVS